MVAAIAAEAAEAIAVVVVIAAAVVAAEAHTAAVVAAAEALMAAEAPSLAGGTNLFANSRARPDLPAGLFLFESDALSFLLPRQLSLQKFLSPVYSF